MGTLLVLLIVSTALILPFLDKIVHQNGPLSDAEDDFHQALDEGDCFRIPNKQ